MRVINRLVVNEGARDVITSTIYLLILLCIIYMSLQNELGFLSIILAILLAILLVERYWFVRDKSRRIIEKDSTLKILEEYERFLDEIPVAILFLKKDSIQYVNDRCLRLFHSHRKDELIGNSIYDFLKLKRITQHKNEKDSFFENEDGDIIGKLIGCNGSEIDVRIHYHQLFFHNEWGYGMVISDITKQKENELKLAHSEQLTLIGEMAAGIAHEIRNPLTSIMGFLQLIDDKNESSKKYKQIMSSELDRINLIVNELLLLSKPKEFEYESKRIVTLIETVVTIANTQAILYNIEIDIDCDEETNEIYVHCEENKLKQVFLNLLQNGIEAMSREGKIVIKLRVVGGNLHISFIDEGEGIPEEKLAKLGNRFYTTKEDGTGLGLMISMNIIREHKGSLKINSEVGKGTEMEVVLPLSS